MSTYKGFTKVKLRKPQRSKFDLSHEKKLSARMGKLVPVFVSETLPNDTFKVNTEIMLRLAPLVAPIYHRVNVFVHFFFVPMRLLYKDWEKFITNGRLGTETPPVAPYEYITAMWNEENDWLAVGSLMDYLGMRPIPVSEHASWENSNSYPFSPLPAAAYYKIWYDYYRDRNYEMDNEILPLPSGYTGNVSGAWAELYQLRTRAWQHDYFTSALPWTQRGDEVLMPVDVVPVYRESAILTGIEGGTDTGGTLGTTLVSSDYVTTYDPITGGPVQVGIDNIESIQNTSVSINDLRQAVRLQEWLERNAVAGSRYNESIMAHFARRTSDGRLQRAEYLGGGRVPVQISEVMTTAWSSDGDDNDVPPANMAGRGATYSNKNSFRYNCEEHGFVMGIMSVMPTSAYMDGTNRMFMKRQSFLDYPWPSFANLGEQPVYKWELYTDPTTAPILDEEEDAPLFGYQSRYADWKYIYSSAHGDFRTSLDYWHLDRKFETVPSLGKEFVTFEDELQDRVFAVAEADTLWCYVHNNVSVVRSLPYFGTPML